MIKIQTIQIKTQTNYLLTIFKNKNKKINRIIIQKIIKKN